MLESGQLMIILNTSIYLIFLISIERMLDFQVPGPRLTLPAVSEDVRSSLPDIYRSLPFFSFLFFPAGGLVDISPGPFFVSCWPRYGLSDGYPSDLLHSAGQCQPIVRCGENRWFMIAGRVVGDTRRVCVSMQQDPVTRSGWANNPEWDCSPSEIL